MRILSFDENEGILVFTFGHAFRSNPLHSYSARDGINVEMFKIHGLVINQSNAQISQIPVEDDDRKNDDRYEKRLTLSSWSDSFKALSIYLVEYYRNKYTYDGDHFIHWSQKALLAYDHLSDEEAKDCQKLYSTLGAFQQVKNKALKKTHESLRKIAEKLYIALPKSSLIESDELRDVSTLVAENERLAEINLDMYDRLIDKARELCEQYNDIAAMYNSLHKYFHDCDNLKACFDPPQVHFPYSDVTNNSKIKSVTDSDIHRLYRKIEDLKQGIKECQRSIEAPLNKSAEKGDLGEFKEFLALLLQKKVNELDEKDFQGCTPLLHIARTAKCVQLLLACDVNPSTCDHEGKTKLHLLSRKQYPGWSVYHSDPSRQQEDLEMMRLLIQADANVNAQTPSGYTPLHCAVQTREDFFHDYEHIKRKVTLLCEGGADTCAVAMEGKSDDNYEGHEKHPTPNMTPLMFLYHYSDIITQNMRDPSILAVAKVLLKYGADIRAVDGEGHNIFHKLAKTNDEGAALYFSRLPEAAQIINFQLTSKHPTPLHIAAYRGAKSSMYLSVLRALLTNSTDPFATFNYQYDDDESKVTEERPFTPYEYALAARCLALNSSPVSEEFILIKEWEFKHIQQDLKEVAGKLERVINIENTPYLKEKLNSIFLKIKKYGIQSPEVHTLLAHFHLCVAQFQTATLISTDQIPEILNSIQKSRLALSYDKDNDLHEMTKEFQNVLFELGHKYLPLPEDTKQQKHTKLASAIACFLKANQVTAENNEFDYTILFIGLMDLQLERIYSLHELEEKYPEKYKEAWLRVKVQMAILFQGSDLDIDLMTMPVLVINHDRSTLVVGHKQDNNEHKRQQTEVEVQEDELGVVVERKIMNDFIEIIPQFPDLSDVSEAFLDEQLTIVCNSNDFVMYKVLFLCRQRVLQDSQQEIELDADIKEVEIQTTDEQRDEYSEILIYACQHNHGHIINKLILRLQNEWSLDFKTILQTVIQKASQWDEVTSGLLKVISALSIQLGSDKERIAMLDVIDKLNIPINDLCILQNIVVPLPENSTSITILNSEIKTLATVIKQGYLDLVLKLLEYKLLMSTAAENGVDQIPKMLMLLQKTRLDLLHDKNNDHKEITKKFQHLLIEFGHKYLGLPRKSVEQKNINIARAISCILIANQGVEEGSEYSYEILFIELMDLQLDHIYSLDELRENYPEKYRNACFLINVQTAILFQDSEVNFDLMTTPVRDINHHKITPVVDHKQDDNEGTMQQLEIEVQEDAQGVTAARDIMDELIKIIPQFPNLSDVSEAYLEEKLSIACDSNDFVMYKILFLCQQQKSQDSHQDSEIDADMKEIEIQTAVKQKAGCIKLLIYACQHNHSNMIDKLTNKIISSLHNEQPINIEDIEHVLPLIIKIASQRDEPSLELLKVIRSFSIELGSENARMAILDTVDKFKIPIKDLRILQNIVAPLQAEDSSSDAISKSESKTLETAIQRGYQGIALKLLENKPSMSRQAERIAGQCGNIEIYRRIILSSAPNSEFFTETQKNALILRCACLDEYPEILKLTKIMDKDIIQQDEDDHTILDTLIYYFLISSNLELRENIQKIIKDLIYSPVITPGKMREVFIFPIYFLKTII